MLFLLLACTGGSKDSSIVESQPQQDSDSDTQQDSETQEDSDTQADSDPPNDPHVANHVLASLTVADRNEGFDLDGDGQVDNALWVLGSVLDPVLASGLAQASSVTITQIAEVDDWTTDIAVRVALLRGDDLDADPTDNLSGTEPFDVGNLVGADGVALLNYPTSLVSGSYSMSLGSESLTIGSLTLEAASGLWLSATPTESSEDGMLGMAVSTEILITALTAAGIPSDATDILNTIADIDTDQDGQADAISMAFHFTGVSCYLN